MPEPEAGGDPFLAEPDMDGSGVATPTGSDAPASAGSHPPGHTACPRCHHSVDESQPGPWLECVSCGWSGRVRWFAPVEEEATVGEAATPDDATCAHHPGRKAEAVCAGSGAYLCPLCTVRLQGRVFDVEYVEAGGVTDLEKAMQRELPRPDRSAILLTYLPLLFSCIGPILWIAALVYGAKHLRLRKQDPLYRQVAMHGWAVFAMILSGLLIVVFVVVLVFTGVGDLLR